MRASTFTLFFGTVLALISYVIIILDKSWEDKK
jgi:hypothetical protein